MHITLAYAQSLDGSIARTRAAPLALSGPESLQYTHRLRAAHDALLVGIGTLLADDPRLTARGVPGGSPQPIILDTRLRTPPAARVFQHPKPPIIFCAPDTAIPAALAHARIERAPLAGERLHLPAVLARLGELGIASLMVEGGAAVITSFLAAGLVSRLAITIAPVLVGGVRALDTLLPDTRLASPAFTALGSDLLFTADLA
jgi:3,4-dihydroxy 2-butanone 4-phosphate synthase/GTP cyclohydrolase II